MSAVEVENCLYDHPAVWEVAVFSVPDSVHGEQVTAAITCKPGSKCSADEIKLFVKERMAGFKVPGSVIFSEQPLPRNASGKILKKQIREDYLAEQ
nr:hypothetical protein [Oceanicoccus sp. KOV_DT_Chl]